MSASAAQLDDLWASFVDDARRESLSEPTPILRDERPGEASLANIEALDLAAADLPPALEATDKGEIASQQEYIDELERLLVGAGLSGGGMAALHGNSNTGNRPAKPPTKKEDSSSATPVGLRAENRMLRAKVLMLQRQLQEAHARCRRAEQVNAEWRQQHGQLRARERESWAALRQAMKKIDRMGDTQIHNNKLREAITRRNADIVAYGHRIAELEANCEHLRSMLGNAIQKEALGALM